MVAAIGGLIGTGYMGKCHPLAWNEVAAISGDVERPRLIHRAERDAGLAQARAPKVGLARPSSDWRDLLAEPDVDVFSIATPNQDHAGMAIAAREAGKHVRFEKPMAGRLRIERSVPAMAQSFAERRWVDVVAS